MPLISIAQFRGIAVLSGSPNILLVSGLSLARIVFKYLFVHPKLGLVKLFGRLLLWIGKEQHQAAGRGPKKI
jgi:hypothetical protein